MKRFTKETRKDDTSYTKRTLKQTIVQTKVVIVQLMKDIYYPKSKTVTEVMK